MLGLLHVTTSVSRGIPDRVRPRAGSSARATEREPWSDSDPAEPPRRFELSDYGFRGGAEYRTQAIWVNPVNLSNEKERRAAWLEQHQSGRRYRRNELLFRLSDFDVRVCPACMKLALVRTALPAPHSRAPPVAA